MKTQKKTQAKKSDFKTIAKLSCKCGCGKTLSVDVDIGTGKWIVASVKTGWKEEGTKHIGFDIIVDEFDTKNIEKFIKGLSNYLEIVKKRSK